ncbi:WRC domain-containing protein [Heracleum sosnowskyi]|uniref:WRC domain-containing protein n=1 Tax=Heracleum sosnowskyi TaxID=360622 RepID=A0AAD8HEP3_9APIA|nr:WRC domain-containing protein [Heracleum sosnowskyi]
MRIRKNSVRVPSESGTHLCQLNQSPWDVPTTFSSSASASATVPPFFQVLENESFLQNKALESIGINVGSVTSLNISLAGGDKEAVNINYCSKTDENGNWICGLEAKEGETFCEFHLQSYIPSVTKKSSSNIKQAKKAKPESNPYKSLYYYDGFGPTWGKRKIARELSKRSEDVFAMELLPESEIFKDVEEDDTEEIEVDDGDENGKKRVRKRIKARSLKSLM